MGILKGILHHWNKTSKAYDTIHPETEVAQITDWDNGIVNTLASTALGGLVTTLSSDSLLAKLIGKVLTASGARYQSGSNGYICFGSYFGNHIIQWGRTEIPASSSDAAITVTLPLTSSSIINALSACLSPLGATGLDTPNNTKIIVKRSGAWPGQLIVYWLLVCR